MEIKCELIKDLLPLYVEGLCCEYTKSVVDDHILTCEECGNLVKELITQNQATESGSEIRNAANPFRKVKRRYHRIIALSVMIAVVALSSLFVKLFLIGWTAATLDITVHSAGLGKDDFTFEVELSTNSSINAIRQIYLVPLYTMSDYGSGHTYFYVNTVMTLPFSDNAVYKSNGSYDRGALNHDGITAIYLMGKDQNDVRLIWEK